MKKIVFDNPHRKKHFEFFNGMNHPHFNLTANVDITEFLKKVNAENVPTNISLVHALSKTANAIKEFRWRIREQEVVEHSTVHPSFTVSTDEADVPWVSFTSLQHAMSYHPHDSVPRISWGKFFNSGNKVMMPLSVQAHHALVDGRHMGSFFNLFQEYLH